MRWIFDSMNMEYDYKESYEPKTFYCICAVARSGCTLLVRALWDTKLAGKPAAYYQEQHRLRLYGHPKQAVERGAHTEYVLGKRTGPNGVFGFTLGGEELEQFLAEDYFTEFPKIKIIRVERRDKIAQAVSLAKVWQTGEWEASGYNRIEEPKYDATLIQKAHDYITKWDSFMDTALMDVMYLKIIYEEFVENYERTVKEVLDYIGIDMPESLVIESTKMKKQADEINKEWIERFSNE